MVATRRAVAVVSCLLLATAARAQITTGDVVGRVTDQSGAVLPGATITVENAGTHDVRSTVASATGDYVVNLLPIGSYVVRVELESFRPQESRVDLRSGERIRVDAKLAIGGLSDTVQVTAETPLLQTDSSTVSTLVTQNEVQDLPVNGRNFIRLVQLIPGANEGATGNTPATVLHGPPQRRVDLSVFKEFGVGGSRQLQLRYEVYNLTNIANFQNPNSQLGSPAFGSISSTGNSTPRQMQFAAKLLF